ncbi:MAG: HEAT repeat protein [Planctomycetota bacterium]|jgi:HEAT repeat protein
MDLRTHVQGPPVADGRSIATNAPMAPSRKYVQEAVMPRLLDVIENSTSDDIVASALVAAGRLTGPDDVLYGRVLTAMRARMRASNTRVFESAVLSLGLIGTDAACSDLLDVAQATPRGMRLRGTDSLRTRTRAFAAHALGLAAAQSDSIALKQTIASGLIELLEEETHRQSDLPVAAVSSLGLIELGSRMQVPPAAVRESSAADYVLSGGTLTQYLERWTQGKQSGDQRRDTTKRPTLVQCHALVAYARAARSADEGTRIEAIEHLVSHAKERRNHLHQRTASTIAMGELVRGGNAKADRAAREYLLEAMSTGQPLERRFARIALASASGRAGAGEEPFAGWRQVHGALTKSLVQSRSSDMAWSALSLGILEDSLAKAGIDTGRSGTSALRTLAVKRRSGDDSAALALGLALATRNREDVATFGPGVIKEFDETTTPYLRGHVSVALGLMDHRASIPRLEAELEAAANQPIRLWSAAVGLVLMGEPVGAKLVQALRESNSSQSRIAIAAALGQAGTFRAVAPLLDLMGDDGQPTPLRASAVDALGAVCDLSRLPWRDPVAHALPYFAATPTLISGGAGVLERPW